LERALASVFFSYSHADEALRDQLEKQLALLKRQGVIETWHDRRIGAGGEIDPEISVHVEKDDILLLLISSDFLASDYCYQREMLRAMERHAAGEAIVIPVILRACDWHGAPFGKLMATPPDGRPITQWPDRDQAFLEVARAVRGAADRLTKAPTPLAAPAPAISMVPAARAAPGVRSSNLRVAKRFTDRDKDVFRHDAFEYIAKYFENSLQELKERNPEIEGIFRRIDANRFTAVAYSDGRTIARCTIFMGGLLHGGISYSASETTESNSFNENLTVDADNLALSLRSMGMASFGRAGQRDEKLSFEGGAELYWSIFVEPLQRR
jgi:hypothetical protein